MEQEILTVAKKCFGESRYEEVLGQLWIDLPQLTRKILHILREWEDRQRRDVEEGQFRHRRKGRQRAIRFSELVTGPEDQKIDRLDLLSPRIRRKF